MKKGKEIKCRNIFYLVDCKKWKLAARLWQGCGICSDWGDLLKRLGANLLVDLWFADRGRERRRGSMATFGNSVSSRLSQDFEIAFLPLGS